MFFEKLDYDTITSFKYIARKWLLGHFWPTYTSKSLKELFYCFFISCGWNEKEREWWLDYDTLGNNELQCVVQCRRATAPEQRGHSEVFTLLLLLTRQKYMMLLMWMGRSSFCFMTTGSDIIVWFVCFFLARQNCHWKLFWHRKATNARSTSAYLTADSTHFLNIGDILKSCSEDLRDISMAR